MTFLEMQEPPATLFASADEPPDLALLKTAQHAAALLPLPDGPGRPEVALGECAAA